MIVASAQIEISWPTQQSVPLLGYFQIYKDAQDSAVDYDSPVNPSPIPAWPDGAGKLGDGLGEDGEGADGYGHGGMGDGIGADGMGMDGFGAAMLSFVTPPLDDGDWEIAVVGYDGAGNAITPATIEQAVSLAGTPDPPGIPEASAYDDGPDSLTIDWELSDDDS